MATFAAPRKLRARTLGLGLCLSIIVGWACQTARTEAETTAASSPPAGKLTLDACLEMGLSRQPALAAARASLAAAESGFQAVENIGFCKFLTPDYRFRRDQSCLGVNIAAAGLTQAEWETRYAVRRTYYSIQYAKMQYAVIDRAVGKIEQARDKAKKLVDQGAPDIKVTQIDVDILEINAQFLKTKRAEAATGIKKAEYGLREAIGVIHALEIADENLPPFIQLMNQEEIVNLALANRPELQQARDMFAVTDLEVAAQRRIFFKPKVQTFASFGDIHAKPIPTGVANGEYRPGAIGPEMPPVLAGKRSDRVQRAGDFNARALAVVDKTEILIALEAQAAVLKWLEAAENIYNLKDTPKKAEAVAGKVQKRFNDGNATGEEYLRTNTLVDQAQALLNQAYFEHALALAAIERVTAGGYRMPAGK